MLLRHYFVVLLAPVVLCGCGTVAKVRTAFEMPVAPTPSPQQLARAKNSRSFESLSKAIGGLNSQTLQPFFGKSGPSKVASARATRQPSPLSSDPARALALDLGQSANVPISPISLAVPIAPVEATISTDSSPVGRENTRLLSARQIGSERIPALEVGTTNATRALLRGWEARESLRRADQAVLRRRSLEDRIALQTLGARPSIDLSLVSPETQLELSNLRLQLLPLLSVAPAKRAQATAQIEAIEARLKAIWERETERQEALLRQSLVEVPARLRVEGERALGVRTREDIAQTRARLAQVQRELQAQLSSSQPAPSLGIVLRAASVPDPRAVGAALGSRLSSGGREAMPVRVEVLPGKTDIARRGGAASGRTAQTVAEKNDRIWRAATR